MSEYSARLFDDVSLAELRQRGSKKWSTYGDDVLAAWVAEMDYPLAPVLQDTLQQAVQRSCTGYPVEDQETGLPEACARWLAGSFGFAVAPRRIQIVADVLRGIELALTVFSPPDSAVVIPTPSYPPFLEVAPLARRPVVQVPMVKAGEEVVLDLDGIETALQRRARTVLLCNPYNPLGKVFRHAELAALADLVERYGARVIADEVHAPLVYPGAHHVCYATVSEEAAQHSVTLTSASKGWNLPGLKCACLALTREADLRVWEQLPHVQTRGASILGILANTAAFAQGGLWLTAAVAYLDGNRRLLAQLLTELLPDIRWRVPDATYLAWLDCGTLGLESPSAFFLQRARVALSDGADFGPPGYGHLRLNFATSRTILQQMVERMAAALAAGRDTVRSAISASGSGYQPDTGAPASPPPSLP